MNEYLIVYSKGGGMSIKAAKFTSNADSVVFFGEAGELVAVFNLEQIVAVINTKYRIA
jgi:hypothetical protein